MQQNVIMTKKDWKFAILFSATLTVFNGVDKSPNVSDTNWIYVVLSWLLVFIFLMTNWVANSHIKFNFGNYRNERISFTRFLTIIVCNSLLMLLLMLLYIQLLDGMNFGWVKNLYLYIIILVRGGVGICLIYIIQTAINSNEKAQEIQLKNEMLKTENVRSQLEILKQQVSPHFLFNSLATLRSMIRLHNPNSEQFVIKLAEMYRQLLIKRQHDVATVKDELNFVNDYIFMLNARFDKMLHITIDIPESLYELKLPTFSLQLLLENCMKHNIVSAEKPLRIKIFSSTPDTVTVENNLQSKFSQFEKSGYGLENLDQRYNLLGWPDSVTVFLDDDIFRVKLQLLNI